MATKVNTKIQDRKVIRDLEFELTDAEIMSISDRAANCARQVSEVTTEFKSVKDDFTAKLRTLNANMRVDLEKVRTKRETRTVDCIERYNYDTREVITLHGKKVMETRAMRGDEFQTFMDLEKKNQKKTTSKKVVGMDSFKGQDGTKVEAKVGKGKKGVSDEKKLLAEKSQLHTQSIDREMRNTTSALNA